MDHHGEGREKVGDGEPVVFFGVGDPRAIEDRKHLKLLNLPRRHLEEKLMTS
jgi:hypothetical protein